MQKPKGLTKTQWLSKSCVYITRNHANASRTGDINNLQKGVGDSGNQRNPFSFCFFASLLLSAFAFS